MRADRLSAYGYLGSVTPNMDRLGREGVRFATAYCDIPWTTGSMASTMTGTYGPRHGVQSMLRRLPEDRTTLAEILRAHGFTTAAVIGSFSLDSAFHLDQGFASYDDNMTTPLLRSPGKPVEAVELPGGDADLTQADLLARFRNNAYRSDAAVTRAALAWMEPRQQQPFFLWVHYFGPHERFTVRPDSNRRKEVLAEYDKDAQTTDAAVGSLLSRLDKWGIAKDTLVILHSDHGQAFYEHGIFGHGHDLYEESVRIPLMMRLPGRIDAGTVVENLARNVDILPTVLDYVGIAPPGDADGSTLRPAIEHRPMPEHSAYMEMIDAAPSLVRMPLVGAFFASSTWRGLRVGAWKYLNVSVASPCRKNPDRMKLDAFGMNPNQPIGGVQLQGEACTKPLRQDLYPASGRGYVPERLAQNNAVGANKEIAASLAAAIRAVGETGREGEGLPLTDEEKDKLRSLGYLQ